METQQLIRLAGMVSMLTFIGSLVAVPWWIGRLDRRYFIRLPQDIEAKQRLHPGWMLVRLLARNLSGLVLIAAGLAMLVLPGQGILTLVIGLSLLDFPGKRALLGRILAQPSVRRGLNWLRRKQGKELFVFSLGDLSNQSQEGVSVAAAGPEVGQSTSDDRRERDSP